MVCISAFLEAIFTQASQQSLLYNNTGIDCPIEDLGAKRALRAKQAENGEYVKSPCGIMDQFIISTANENHLCLIKCGGEVGGRIVEMVPFGGDNNSSDAPVLLVCDCGVRHSIAGGEYPIR